MLDFKPIHCEIKQEDTIGNKGKGRIFIIPGSNDRASRIASEYMKVSNIRKSTRGHHLYLGTTLDNNIDIGVISTGMGCPSMDIIASELILMGVKHLIRIGTAGSLNLEKCPVGNIIIATGAVRDETTSKNYAPIEVPAIPNYNLLQSLTKEASHKQYPTSIGILHTKDSLFVREFNQGVLSEESEKYMAYLKQLGVLASEMESSHLFILGQTYGVNTASVCAVIGGDSEGPFSENQKKVADAVTNAIGLTLSSLNDYLNSV